MPDLHGWTMTRWACVCGRTHAPWWRTTPPPSCPHSWRAQPAPQMGALLKRMQARLDASERREDEGDPAEMLREYEEWKPSRARANEVAEVKRRAEISDLSRTDIPELERAIGIVREMWKSL